MTMAEATANASMYQRFVLVQARCRAVYIMARARARFLMALMAQEAPSDSRILQFLTQCQLSFGTL